MKNDVGGDFSEIPTYGTETASTTVVDAHLIDHSQMQRDAALAFELQIGEQESARVPLQRIGSKYWDFQFGHNKPVFTILMVFLNCLGFLVTMYKADFEFDFDTPNIMIGPSAQALLDAGGQTSTGVSCEGEWWRIFASMFLHAGLVHLGFNMLSLWQLGGPMETQFGAWQVILIYSLSGLAGQLASAVFLPDLVTIGASGAIFGLFGAQWADFLQNYAFFSNMEGKFATFAQLSFSTVIAIGFTLIPFVNAFAHLAGFITGSLVGYIVLIRRRTYTDSRTHRQRFLKLTTCQQFLMFGALILILSEMLILAVLFGEDDVYSTCEWCEYLQCFDTPIWDCLGGAATCSFRSMDSSAECVSLDATFSSSQDCVVITCLDGSFHPFDQVPTAFDCFDICGSDYSQCS